jgi:hypothetical protein
MMMSMNKYAEEMVEQYKTVSGKEDIPPILIDLFVIPASIMLENMEVINNA